MQKPKVQEDSSSLQFFIICLDNAVSRQTISTDLLRQTDTYRITNFSHQVSLSIQNLLDKINYPASVYALHNEQSNAFHYLCVAEKP